MKSNIIHTKSAKETQKIARQFAEKIKQIRPDSAVVIALKGELGAGKTTFVQGFVRVFGIKENVLSPTFVLMKMYAGEKGMKHLIHIDCYRLRLPEEISHLGFDGLLGDKDAVILIEWADKIKKILPNDTLWITFKYGEKPEERSILFGSSISKQRINFL